MNELIKSEQLTMSSLEIAELTAKRHDNVLIDIKNMLTELKIQSPEFSGDYKDHKGRTYPCYNLPKRETLILIAGYNVVVRAKIIDRWQELEAKQTTVALPQTYLQALEHLLTSEKEKQLVIQQRDEAIRTKAFISSSREASVMGKLSAEKRRADKLADQLGEGKSYVQVKAIPWLKEFFNLKDPIVYSVIGKYLSHLCDVYGYSKIEIPNTEYGRVNAYHIDAINKLHELLIADVTLLSKYRIFNVTPFKPSNRIVANA